MSEPVNANLLHAPLAALRRRLRTLLVVHRVGWLVGGLVAALVVVGLVDYALHLPMALRLIILVAGVVGIVLYWRRTVAPAASFNPSLEDLALRVERTDAARSVGLTGVLASGVSLADSPVAEAASSKLSSLNVARVIDPRRSVRAASFGALAAVALLSLFAVYPALTWIGARRTLTPWTAAAWPKRADVRDVTGLAVHPLGSALPIRAAIVKGADRATPRDARVTMKYRVNRGPWREVGMTYQEKHVAVPVQEGEDLEQNGPLFEHLIDPSSLTADATGTLDYTISSQDDRTDLTTIALVPPPVIAGATLIITPPFYAAAMETRTIEAGPGIDERANVTGVLPGSRVELALRFTKHVAGIGQASPAMWARTALGEQASALLADADTKLTTTPTQWTLVWKHRATVRLMPHARDERGVESAADSVYRVELREDRAPEAVIIEPATDTEVLASATVSVTGEARDDVGIRGASLWSRVASVPGQSTGAGAEAAPEQKEIASEKTSVPSGVKIAGTIALTPLNLQPGQEVWLTLMATDAYELDGKGHDPVTSPVRKLRVISAEQFVEKMWQELSGVRRQAMRLAEQQERLAEETAKGKDGSTVARQQNEITENATRAADAVAAVAKRLRENNVADADLTALVGEAKSLLDKARQSSGEATDAARASGDAKRAGDSSQEKAKRDEASKHQADAAAALEQLAEALDRGQDAWAATRSIQKLIQDQDALRDATSKLGEKTVGKAPEEITGDLKRQSDALAEQQDQLARRTDEAIRSMQDRAEQLRQKDPATASAMQDAASKGQRAGVSDQMQQAGKQIRKNQQQQASQQQSKASQGLQQMLDQLKQQQQSRDAVLRRQLDSLIDAIGALIKQQETNLAVFRAAEPTAEFKGLDQPMIKLHASTLAATGQALDAGREARKAASLLAEAAEAQQSAVSALRAEPVEPKNAAEHEETSLEKLKAAKAEAESQKKQAQDRDERRKRAELKQAYQQMLADQAALAVDSEPLIGKEVDRRQRIAAGELADRQDQLAARASDLMKETRELRDTELFTFAHDRLDAASRAASTGLREETIPVAVARHQNTAQRVLKQIIDALEDGAKQDDEPFRTPDQGNQQQSGQGQGGGGLIPPAAELKLLKSMQEEALAVTREADKAADKALAAEAGALQNELFRRADRILKKMQQNQQGR